MSVSKGLSRKIQVELGTAAASPPTPEVGGAPTEDRSYSGADYGGPGRGRVKRSKARSLRRAAHVTEHRLALGTPDSEERRRTRG